MSIHDDLMARNARFAAHFDRGDMPILPDLRTLILTCVDARVDPAVPAIGFSAHGLDHGVVFQKLTILTRGVLAAAFGVVNEVWRRTLGR